MYICAEDLAGTAVAAAVALDVACSAAQMASPAPTEEWEDPRVH
jgi:hypothetical protein